MILHLKWLDWLVIDVAVYQYLNSYLMSSHNQHASVIVEVCLNEFFYFTGHVTLDKPAIKRVIPALVVNTRSFCLFCWACVQQWLKWKAPCVAHSDFESWSELKLIIVRTQGESHVTAISGEGGADPRCYLTRPRHLCKGTTHRHIECSARAESA